MGCGIYKIENLINCKIYIGSSINLDKRIRQHRIMLNGGYHDNNHLQHSVLKYGINNFSFDIIEECLKDKLVELENYYIDYYKSNVDAFGYNLAKVSDDRKNIFHNNVKIKMSKTKIKQYGNFKKFKLINITTGETIIFDNLVEASIYFINNGFTKSKENKVRMILSKCLRNKIVNNGTDKGSIRKTIYKHKWEIIN